jgi:hypothetical protein
MPLSCLQKCSKSRLLPKVEDLGGYLVNFVGTNCLCRGTLTGGRSTGVCFLGGFLFKRIRNTKAPRSAPNTRPIRIAPHPKGPQGTGLNLKPRHLRLIPARQSMHFSRMDRRGDLLRDEV